jgi:hypothetical protein
MADKQLVKWAVVGVLAVTGMGLFSIPIVSDVVRSIASAVPGGMYVIGIATAVVWFKY